MLVKREVAVFEMTSKGRLTACAVSLSECNEEVDYFIFAIMIQTFSYLERISEEYGMCILT